MTKLKNVVRYEYREEKRVWSLYDDMEPSGIDVKIKHVEFDSTSDIEVYCNQFKKFLLTVGFSESEVDSCFFRMHYYDEVPGKVEPTKEEGILPTRGPSIGY